MDPQELTSEQAQSAARDSAIDWLSKIETREKEFETTWWKRGEIADGLYDGGKKGSQEANLQDIPYNILYSNTEVLLPSLYSATPKPDVRSRFVGADVKPIPDMIERFLRVAADPASPGGDCFDNAMLDCTLSALVPGMGYVRIKYIESRSFPITYESGHYKTLIWGKASRWAKVPWVAFKHPMSKSQMLSQFGIESEGDNLEDGFEASDDAEDKNACCVWELWDKASKKVLFLSNEWVQREVKSSDDPLGLENFFPTPGPMILTPKAGKFEPTPLYDYYRNQAEELNRVSVRLNKVLSAIRVRGAYNGLLGEDLKNLLSDTDMENSLVPASQAGLLAQQGGFDKQIWMLPIEKFITVATELYRAREAIKQVIYEITGISDIIRGSSVASETATAQDLKNKWGTVRLRRMQTVVANYARDLFRMTIDCSADHVPADKWKEIIQLPLPTAEEKALAQQQAQYLQQTGAQPDENLLKTLQSSSIEELLEKISSDMNRTFVVNIQTSSTIDLDTAQDKNDINEFMNSMGQLLGGLQSFVALGPTGMEAAKAILIAVCQRFKFGIDIVPVLEKLEAPPAPEEKTPPGPTPEEQAASKAESEYKMQELAGKKQVLEAKISLELAQVETEKQKLALSIQEAQIRLEGIRMKALMPQQPPKAKNAPVSN